MPRLWANTVDAHRESVREAVVAATAALVAAQGLTDVTMSRIAQDAGIGRATLYKYFPDVESILAAWHERQVAGHLAQLTQAAERVADPGERLAAVLTAYARLARGAPGPHGADLAALLHRGAHVGHAERHLHGFLTGLVADAARAGDVRTDVPAAELAGYCLHAVAAARTLRSRAAVRRLVTVTLAGLRPGT